ncbi:MAG: porin [Nitrospira sp.]|nr:porin [Nitrospira sp.]
MSPLRPRPMVPYDCSPCGQFRRSCRLLFYAWIGLPILLSVLCVHPARGEDAEDTHSDWHHGGIVDVSYALNLHYPDDHRWRSKSTTTHVNEWAPNMVMGYVRKDATVNSRWGLEFGLQAGYDTDGLVPAAVPGRDKPVDGADTLRHLSRANVSYLAPLGNGLLLTAGLFNSFIGYQSIYSPLNLHYTRSYMADHAPYFMFGVGASTPINESLTVGLYVINGFSYLSHANDQPSYGGQVVYKAAPHLIVTENLYYGPDQSSTNPHFWRFFSDSIIEWRHDRIILAAAYDVGTENAAEQPGHPRTFWMGAALFAHWNLTGPWSVGVRPELYWDRNGRITGSEQLLKAITSTVEYRLSYPKQNVIVRLEHRYDQSTGTDGGFFINRTGPDTTGFARDQQLVLLSLAWRLDT